MTIDLGSTDGMLILNDVNADVGEWGILTVNAKGLVTAARKLHRSDVITALTYTPYNGVVNPQHFLTVEQFPLTAAANGCTKLPNGLMFQWGTTSFSNVPSDFIELESLGTPAISITVGIDAEPVEFPEPFPHAVFSCTGTGVNNDNYIEGCEVAVGIMTLTNAGVQFRVGRVFGSESGTPLPEGGNVMWMAIGN